MEDRLNREETHPGGDDGGLSPIEEIDTTDEDSKDDGELSPIEEIDTTDEDSNDDGGEETLKRLEEHMWSEMNMDEELKSHPELGEMAVGQEVKGSEDTDSADQLQLGRGKRVRFPRLLLTQ